MSSMSKHTETRGQKLQRIRLAKGMSQADLARVSGVPKGTLQCLEQDYRSYPSVDTAMQLAAALGECVEDVFGPVQGPKRKRS